MQRNRIRARRAPYEGQREGLGNEFLLAVADAMLALEILKGTSRIFCDSCVKPREFQRQLHEVQTEHTDVRSEHTDVRTGLTLFCAEHSEVQAEHADVCS